MKRSPLKQDTKYYSNPHAYILDELRWLNRLITAYVLLQRRVNFYEGLKDFREFFISKEEIDALLATGIFEKEQANEEKYTKQISGLFAQATKIREEINQRIRKSTSKNVFLPIAQIASCFQLTDFEFQALMVCLAPQVDPRYEKLYAYLQNDSTKRHPTIDLVFSLLDLSIEERISARDYFSPQAPMFKFRILEYLENGHAKNIPLLSKHLKVNDRITGYLLGSRFIDSDLSSVAELYYTQKGFDSLILPDLVKNKLVNFVQHYKDGSGENRQNILFSFYGSYGVGKKEAATAFCREIGLPLLIIDVAIIQNLELPLKQILELAFREGMLLPAALYFKNAEIIFDDRDNSGVQREIFLKTLNENSLLSFIGSNKILEVKGRLSNHRFIEVEFPVSDYAKRLQIWQQNLNGRYSESEKIDITELAGKFNFTNGQIRDAIATARNLALSRSPENGQINFYDLYEGCRAQSNQKLKILSQKIKPKYVWKDIVLPKDQMTQLYEITNYVKYKHLVYDDWGFDRKISLGRGLNVLFSGPSGTGKTMAAEIMANQLNLDMYKIDLSTVVSKYIGETEKNLNKIFKEAETSNAILFFDEADALFGKRSEVKDAHDRYANIEIGYLLQKMDEYEGTVILATNMRKNMDDAFVRRLHFTVEFPFPDENDRLRLWHKVFPNEIPLSDDIDLVFLARKFKISGGNIKNIAVAAAFYAADDGQIVNMSNLIHGVKREFQKMGKLCVKAEFDKYYDLLQNNS